MKQLVNGKKNHNQWPRLNETLGKGVTYNIKQRPVSTIFSGGIHKNKQTAWQKQTVSL